MNYYLGILHKEINGHIDKLYALFRSEKSTFSSKDDDFIKSYLFSTHDKYEMKIMMDLYGINNHNKTLYLDYTSKYKNYAHIIYIDNDLNEN